MNLKILFFALLISSNVFSQLTHEQYHDLSEQQREKKNYVGALSSINKAIELKKIVDYYKDRAWCYQQLDSMEQAVKDYDLVILNSPSDMVAYMNRGAALLSLERFEEAMKNYETGTNVTNEIYQKNKDTDNDFSKIMKKTFALNTNKVCRQGMAKASIGLGDNETAISILNKLLEHSEGSKIDAASHYYRGMAYFNLGANKYAMKDFKMASKYGFKDAKNMIKKLKNM